MASPSNGISAGAGAVSKDGADPFAAAMELFNAGRHAEAEKAFGDVAKGGSKRAPEAALYSAKSAEKAFGCGKAGQKYELVASFYGTSSVGAEATWSAANCYRSTGELDRARTLYKHLRSVAGYRDRAEAELENLKILQQQQVAAREAERQQKAAAKPAPAKPAAPASPKPAADTQ